MKNVAIYIALHILILYKLRIISIVKRRKPAFEFNENNNNFHTVKISSFYCTVRCVLCINNNNKRINKWWCGTHINYNATTFFSVFLFEIENRPCTRWIWKPTMPNDEVTHPLHSIHYVGYCHVENTNIVVDSHYCHCCWLVVRPVLLLLCRHPLHTGGLLFIFYFPIVHFLFTTQLSTNIYCTYIYLFSHFNTNLKNSKQCNKQTTHTQKRLKRIKHSKSKKEGPRNKESNIKLHWI